MLHLSTLVVCLMIPGPAADTLPRPDTMQIRQLTEIVVSASRVAERGLRSPVSIEVLDSRTIRQSAQPSYFDAIENLKGIQLLTPSLGFKVYNTRGFANTTNVRFVQLVDGRDNQAPHIGAPIANALAPSDLDIERVEVIPGTASALYGMNALNGLVNLLTKNPFYVAGSVAEPENRSQPHRRRRTGHEAAGLYRKQRSLRPRFQIAAGGENQPRVSARLRLDCPKHQRPEPKCEHIAGASGSR